MSRWQTFLRLTQHAHRVNESLAVVCDETVTKTQVLSVMRKDGAVSKKGTEKEGEEESREEQELVSDAQPQPSTEESAISTLIKEVRALKDKLRSSEQRGDEVEAIQAAHAAEEEMLKNEMLAKEKREREELEETTKRHLGEFKALMGRERSSSNRLSYKSRKSCNPT